MSKLFEIIKYKNYSKEQRSSLTKSTKTSNSGTSQNLDKNTLKALEACSYRNFIQSDDFISEIKWNDEYEVNII